ncbi:hypothetical protein R1T40_18185 [Tritonibacter scottomollicae]|uniref:Helix-turn-helix domain protein n=1 Tax=Tritonibacter scottomollicae TaxID=483013 RepID=A0ABZ0HDD6_TRISK|nr:hypothetical protein [Tritonibacter scottomollicae]WOI32843.1 hypothetical protein R1T40_18185 [Tritonibacter scottomollicae]
MEQERLLSPKQLSEIVGLSPAQIRALMNDGRLEFIAISSKTKRLTMSGWERFQKNATKVKSCESEITAAN